MGNWERLAGARAFRTRLHEIIFESETPAGKAFDVLLLWAILLSVLAVVLESVSSIRLSYGPALRTVEWIFTILFTVEYVSRLLCVRQPLRYAASFFGIVDLLALLPTYLSLFFAGTQTLIVIRALRLLRVFRIFKLGRYVGEANILVSALRASRPKVTVFLGAVMTIVLIVGTLMYLIEGETNGFTSIPRSLYWAIVTMTTVGYGDIAPQTPLGQLVASGLMIIGYGVIAVPTGIVTVEIAEASRRGVNPHLNAGYCKHCGAQLNPSK